MGYADYADAAYNGLMSWYDWGSGQWHDKHDPGWWNWANALTVVINYSRLRPVSNIADIISTTYSKNNSSNFAYQPRPGWEAGIVDTFGGTWDKQTVYDDEAWWALAWLAAYEVTNNTDYLGMASAIFNNMTSAWTWQCNGGLWWNTPDDSHPHQKNAIENELFFALAARLAVVIYRLLDTERYLLYLSWAKAVLNWFDKSGMQNSAGLINDGLYMHTCCNNMKPAYTYNQGVILGGFADMFAITGDRTYLDRGWNLFNAVKNSTLMCPDDGVLHELTDPSQDACQFKGIFVRNLSYLFDAEDNGDRLAAYASFFADNANLIWNNNRSGNLFGYYWEGPFDDADSTRQSSALDALVAAIRLDSSGSK